MVKSKINSQVDYDESKDIEDEDLDYSSPMYDYKLFDNDIIIATDKYLQQVDYINNQSSIINNKLYLRLDFWLQAFLKPNDGQSE
jgi:beta-lactamase class D